MSTDLSPDDRVLVGRVVRPHGLQGTVVVETITDRPAVRFEPGAVIYTGDGRRLTVERFEATPRSPLLTFSEVEGRDGAEGLRNAFLYIPSTELRPLDDGEYWPDELAGMEVSNRAGERLGQVVEVEIGVGQDRLLVEIEGRIVPVPFVSELVPIVDRDRRQVVVDLPDGLME